MYWGYFFVTLILSLILTPLLAALMYKLKVVDKPRSNSRKIHKKKVPYGGGLAVFLSFFIVIAAAYWGARQFGVDIESKHLLGLFIGGAVLMVGGFLDDKFVLPAKEQIWFPIVAALLIIAFGVGPHAFTNPFGGGLINLAQIQIEISGLGKLVLLADLVVFVWLMGMMFTTKFLDGLDGLAAGIVTIGALVLFFLSLQPAWYQPDVALVSIIFVGALLGFLVWNWHPAKVFLGEGGSLFIGFVLGVLAMISDGKVATTLLVMGLPALDVLRVIIRRWQKRRKITEGDDEHLHFKLMASGLKHYQAVLLMYTISLLFGLSALFLQSTQKLIALLLLLALMILIGFWFARKDKQISPAS